MNHSPRPSCKVSTRKHGGCGQRRSQLKEDLFKRCPLSRQITFLRHFLSKLPSISIRFLWKNPKTAIDRVQVTLRKMARKEKLMLLIIELLLETFICSLLLFWFIYSLDFCCRIFFLIYAQEKINGPTLYNSLEFWW